MHRAIAPLLLLLALQSQAQTSIVWTPTKGLDLQEVKSLGVAPGRPSEVWAAAGTIGVFVSRDAGANWQLTAPGDARTMFVRDDVMLAGFGCEVRRSLDQGKTWTLALSQCSDGIAGQAGNAGPLFIVATADTYRSIDRGQTWSKVPTVASKFLDYAQISPHDANIVLLGGSSAPVFRSTDGGVTFTQTILPNARAMAFDPDRRGVVVAASSVGVHRSADYGATWTTGAFTTDTGSSSGTILVLYAPFGSGRIYAGGSFGVAQSIDGGATWQIIQNGLVYGSPTYYSAWVQTLALAGNRLVAGNWRSSNATYPAGGYLTILPYVIPPSVDTDSDGSPDFTELDNGTNLLAKDNDIFAETALGRRLYVQQQYRDFLGREGDSAGVASWVSALQAGSQTRTTMADAFLGSQEFQANIAPVARLYFATYLRIPDAAGLLYWAGQLRAGAPLNAIAQTFASSAEFVARYGALSNRAFVSQLYLNVLGRPGDEGGITYWTSQLEGGVPRGTMLAQFSQSGEYASSSANAVYVTMVYIGMLRREPDQAGFTFWRDQVARGASSLVGLFLAAREYRLRFLPQ